MKNLNVLKINILLLIFALLNMRMGCFKDEIDAQVEIQEILISPEQSGMCWTLYKRGDSEEYIYYLKYYAFETKLLVDNGGVANLYYAEPYRITQLFKIDNRGPYRIDDNIMDCSNGGIDELNHMFYRTSDYPNFHRKTVHTFTNNLHSIKVSDANNPKITDTSFYYYEELYFDRSGKFKKKIYLDPGCNPILITGSWYFRTPFAKIIRSSDLKRIEFTESEIILNYDNAPQVGLPPKGNNVYKVSCYDNAIVISQNSNTMNEVSRVLRQNYTMTQDKIISVPGQSLKDIKITDKHNEDAPWGKVKNKWTSVCGFIVNQRDDMIEIEDSLELHETRVTIMESIYTMKPIRCTSPVNYCPLYCGLTLCGNFNAITFDDDNIDLNHHKSDITITADSTVLTIGNFANLGYPITVKMASHCWVSCYNTDAFDITLSGKVVHFETFIVADDGLGAKWLEANCTINGEIRRIEYRL